MSIVGFFENTQDRSGSGTIREAPEYRRSFTVRVDNPNESLLAIGSAPGIKYGDLHPDDPSTYVKTIDIAAEGDSLLLYRVTFVYGIVADESVSGGAAGAGGGGGGGGAGSPAQPPDPLAIPQPTWSGSAGLYSKVMGVDAEGVMLTNTAGTPFSAGVAFDRAEGKLVLTKYYAFDAFSQLVEDMGLLNFVNSDEWPGTGVGSEKGSWRLTDGSWNFRQQSSDGSTLSFYEAQFTFAFRRGPAYVQGQMRWSHTKTAAASNAYQAQWGSYVPGCCPIIVSQGYEMLDAATGKRVAIERDIDYKDCSGNPVSPPSSGPNTPCEWPTSEKITEPMPLDINGQVVPPNTTGALVIVNSIGPWKIDFKTRFGTPIPSP